MKNFNLMVSTGRDFEDQAEYELWFNLLALGDESPIIFRSGNQGLILAKTTINPKDLIQNFREITQHKDKNYVQFIHKITPIDIVVPSNLDSLKEGVLKLIENHPMSKDSKSKYRITVKKRQSELRTSDIIDKIGSTIQNDVSLKDFDWNVQVEVIGDSTGISLLRKTDIFKPISEKRVL
ncbi:MAG: THUMP domain-containing protein [Promethearchaeota archaeon]